MTNKKEKKYDLEQFELYKYHLKIILDNENKINSQLYSDLINQGTKLKYLKWVEEFINDNTKYLEEKEKENTYNYGKALLEFAKKTMKNL